jgi:hypothetical protein
LHEHDETVKDGGIGVGVGVGVAVGVGVGFGVGVGVGVAVGFGVGFGVGVGVGVAVGAMTSAVAVAVGVLVGVTVGVDVLVGVAVNVSVGVGETWLVTSTDAVILFEPLISDALIVYFVPGWTDDGSVMVASNEPSLLTVIAVSNALTGSISGINELASAAGCELWLPPGIFSITPT